MYRVFLKSALLAVASSLVSLPAHAVEVYLFKGAGDFSFINKNMHFSRGLEKIADQMNKEGIHAEVRRFGAVDDALRTIRKRKPESVAFIGHSMGALASLSMARAMKKEGIRVAYLGVIDIPGPVGVAGDNVEWAENYYSVHPVYGRFTNASSHPKAKNIHVFGYMHNRLDDAPKVQNGLLSAVRAVHAAEQKEEPQTQPETIMVNAPQAIQPAASQSLSSHYSVQETQPDPWAEYRIVNVTGQSVQPQYTPSGQTFAATSEIIQPASNIDPVTTSAFIKRPQIGVGATPTIEARVNAGSDLPPRRASGKPARYSHQGR